MTKKEFKEAWHAVNWSGEPWYIAPLCWGMAILGVLTCFFGRHQTETFAGKTKCLWCGKEIKVSFLAGRPTRGSRDDWKAYAEQLERTLGKFEALYCESHNALQSAISELEHCAKRPRQTRKAAR